MKAIPFGLVAVLNSARAIKCKERETEWNLSKEPQKNYYYPVFYLVQHFPLGFLYDRLMQLVLAKPKPASHAPKIHEIYRWEHLRYDETKNQFVELKIWVRCVIFSCPFLPYTVKCADIIHHDDVQYHVRHVCWVLVACLNIIFILK